MIIPVYHIVTAQYPIATTTTVEPGQVIALNATGYAVLADASGGSGNVAVPIGLAADRNRAAEAFEWQNRLSDMGNQTAASGMLSVYMGGGEFYVDTNDSTITTPGGTAIPGVLEDGLTITPGTKLYVSDSNNGMLHTTCTASGLLVAIVTELSGSLASGIPGEYEPGSSVAYADDGTPREWTKIKLVL